MSFDYDTTYQLTKESGLSYYGIRYYDPSGARRMKKDPIGWEGGINLYGFVYNNPISFIDNYGLRVPSSCQEIFDDTIDAMLDYFSSTLDAIMNDLKTIQDSANPGVTDVEGLNNLLIFI